MAQQADDHHHNVVRRTTIRDSRARSRQNYIAGFSRETASACVAACFNELIPNVKDACSQLQEPRYQQTRLWDLYCCDSVSCGVYIGAIGQSPNVDLIINECQNIGFFSIEDPGPPAPNYCDSSTPSTINTSGLPHVTADGALTNPTTLSTDSAELYTVSTTRTSETLVAPTPTSILSSSPTSTNDTNPSPLTGGTKAAIGIFSVIAVLAVAAFFFFLFRRRRWSPRRRSPGPVLIPYNSRPYNTAHSDSGTPLITPPPSASSRNTPLTPPAKLSDRRYLQPAPKQGATRLPASPGVGSPTFPPSPIGVSTPGRSIHRHERSGAKNNIRIPTTTAVPIPPQPPRTSSVYSSSSGPGIAAHAIEPKEANSIHSVSAPATGTSTPPSSATRLPRANEGLPESSSLATPAGPPPSCALPSPPPNHPNSPTFSVSSVSPSSPTFPARSPARSDGPIAPTQQRKTTRPPASISARELRDLTESYERETRESWGSWSGVGGGGPGVVLPTGRKRKSAEKQGEAKTAVALQDLDLEKLGGRY